MPNQLRKNEYVTRGVLKKELSAFEKRLEARIEVTAQSLKEYIDSRTQHVQTSIQQVQTNVQELQTNVQQVQTSIQQLSDKLDRKVEGIVQLIEGSAGRQVQVEERLENHERRITALEQRAT